jgi:hypothetical protein
MKSNINRMIKESFMEGFKRSKFDLQKTIPILPKGGMFTSHQDSGRAFKIALMYIRVWQDQARENPSFFPKTPKEIEKFVDIFIAENSFMEATTIINLQSRDRSNQELLKEAKEAIVDLHRLGAEEKASFCEHMLSQRIGEE